MNNLIFLSLISLSLLAVYHCQSMTTPTYCPTGMYSNGQTYAYRNSASDPNKVLCLAGKQYSSGGFYQSTAGASSAEQCCYNCRTQTNGLCSSWTLDSQGRCYLSYNT